MSLYEQKLEDFVILSKTDAVDGYGGYIPAWTEGETIQAASALDNSKEAMEARKSGALNLFRIYTPRLNNLDFGMILKRVSDSKYFRVTSDGKDKQTPNAAGLDMRSVSAEMLDCLPDASGGDDGG